MLSCVALHCVALCHGVTLFYIVLLCRVALRCVAMHCVTVVLCRAVVLRWVGLYSTVMTWFSALYHGVGLHYIVGRNWPILTRDGCHSNCALQQGSIHEAQCTSLLGPSCSGKG